MLQKPHGRRQKDYGVLHQGGHDEFGPVPNKMHSLEQNGEEKSRGNWLTRVYLKNGHTYDFHS